LQYLERVDLALDNYRHGRLHSLLLLPYFEGKGGEGLLPQGSKTGVTSYYQYGTQGARAAGNSTRKRFDELGVPAWGGGGGGGDSWGGE